MTTPQTTVPESLEDQIPSPIQLRAELESMVRRDLLGPAGGPEEEVDERNVRGRYILGLLAPRGQSILPDDQDDLPSGRRGQRTGRQGRPIGGRDDLDAAFVYRPHLHCRRARGCHPGSRALGPLSPCDQRDAHR